MIHRNHHRHHHWPKVGIWFFSFLSLSLFLSPNLFSCYTFVSFLLFYSCSKIVLVFFFVFANFPYRRLFTEAKTVWFQRFTFSVSLHCSRPDDPYYSRPCFLPMLSPHAHRPSSFIFIIFLPPKSVFRCLLHPVPLFFYSLLLDYAKIFKTRKFLVFKACRRNFSFSLTMTRSMHLGSKLQPNIWQKFFMLSKVYFFIHYTGSASFLFVTCAFFKAKSQFFYRFHTVHIRSLKLNLHHIMIHSYRHSFANIVPTDKGESSKVFPGITWICSQSRDFSWASL